MRTAGLLLLVFLLAGCTQYDPGTGPKESTDYTSCPSWVKLPQGGHIVSRGDPLRSDIPTTVEAWDFRAPSTAKDGSPVKGTAFGDQLLEYEGRPLDFLRFDFAIHGPINRSDSVLLVIDAEVHLEFIGAENGFPTGEVIPSYDVKKGKDAVQDQWVFRSDAKKGYEIYNLTLQVDLADMHDDPWPRGVFAHWWWVMDLDGNPDTPSLLERGYRPEYWYRECGSDGEHF